MSKLYLASQSYSRHMLLRNANIPVTTVGHNADELQYDADASLHDIVRQIAYHKIEHANVPAPHEVDEDIVYVLSADTLSTDRNGALRGKPTDYQDAVNKIKAVRDGSTVSTGFCLRALRRYGNEWQHIDEHVGVVAADIVVDIPDDWIDAYLFNQPYALSANGAIAIEGYGLQFLKQISGSYTAVLGLPLYEVRLALQDLGFYA